jgi:hypothetical protein
MWLRCRRGRGCFCLRGRSDWRTSTETKTSTKTLTSTSHCIVFVASLLHRIASRRSPPHAAHSPGSPSLTHPISRIVFLASCLFCPLIVPHSSSKFHLCFPSVLYDFAQLLSLFVILFLSSSLTFIWHGFSVSLLCLFRVSLLLGRFARFRVLSLHIFLISHSTHI